MVAIKDFEKCCITCKHHLFNDVTEHYYCEIQKEGNICSDHSAWTLDKELKHGSN